MSNDDSKKVEPVYHFNENFSSAFFGNTPSEVSGAKNPSADAKLISNFIDLLTNPDKKESKHEALDIIRHAKAQQFLVDLISMKQYKNRQKELVSACWESGLDFSMHLDFFVNMAIECEYVVAFEAFTVIDEMHGVSDNGKLEAAIGKLENVSNNSDNQSIIRLIVERLKRGTQLE